MLGQRSSASLRKFAAGATSWSGRGRQVRHWLHNRPPRICLDSAFIAARRLLNAGGSLLRRVMRAVVAVSVLTVGVVAVPWAQTPVGSQVTYDWGWQIAAGVRGNLGPVDGIGTEARLNKPGDLAVAPGTNLVYFIDNVNSIRPFDADTREVTTVVAGNGLVAPSSITVSSNGVVFVSDVVFGDDSKARVLRVDPGGSVTVLTDALVKRGTDRPPPVALTGAILYTVNRYPSGGHTVTHLVEVDPTSGSLTDRGLVDPSGDPVGETEELVSIGGGMLLARHSVSAISGAYPRGNFLFLFDGDAWERISGSWVGGQFALDPVNKTLLTAVYEGVSAYPLAALNPSSPFTGAPRCSAPAVTLARAGIVRSSERCPPAAPRLGPAWGPSRTAVWS